MQDFRKIRVWQRAHEMTLELYEITGQFPIDEKYGLTSQMRRAAVSISSNIAEGAGRGSDQDFARFMQMAFGSASELEYQLLLCMDLGLMNKSNFENMNERVSEIKRMLTSFIHKLKAES